MLDPTAPFRQEAHIQLDRRGAPSQCGLAIGSFVDTVYWPLDFGGRRTRRWVSRDHFSRWTHPNSKLDGKSGTLNMKAKVMHMRRQMRRGAGLASRWASRNLFHTSQRVTSDPSALQKDSAAYATTMQNVGPTDCRSGGTHLWSQSKIDCYVRPLRAGHKGTKLRGHALRTTETLAHRIPPADRDEALRFGSDRRLA